MASTEFDIERWIARFPLSGEVQLAECLGGTSPQEIAYREQLRLKITASDDLGRAIPTDMFTFIEGEPDRRDLTKIGGVPYRPAEKPWPLARSGGPKTFLAQYRFAESHDIVGELPGDVLLVFIDNDEDAWQPNLWQPDSISYEWYPLGLRDLIRPDEVPQPYWKFFVGYGLRYRTVAYPDDHSAEVCNRFFSDEALRTYPRKLAVDAFCRINSVKIGGAPFWSYPEHISPEKGYFLPGRFLCSLCQIYPFELSDSQGDLVESIDFYEMRAAKRYLDFADGFMINFFIDENDKVHRGFQKF